MSAPVINRNYRPNTNQLNSAGGTAGLQEASMPAAASPNGGSQWSPTVVNLLVLIVIEMVAFATIRYLFRKVL